VNLLVKPRRTGVPVYMVGLPEDAFEAEAARSKFVRAINLLRKSFPDILEARCTIKSTTRKDKRGRKRYEVKTFVQTPRRTLVHSDSGWHLASIFDRISDKLRRISTKKAKPKNLNKRYAW
jgi:hypothetical protein